MTLTAQDLLPPLLGVAAGMGAGLLLRRLVMPQLARWAARTGNRYDDVFLRGLSPALPTWGALLGLHVGVGFAALSPRAHDVIAQVVLVLLGLSVTWVAARLAAALVQTAGGTDAVLPSARILRNIAQASVLLVGVLVTLSTVGISVTPLLTALGVGGLAVGLALQDTLANLFAGFHLLVSRQVRPGDFVRLGSGQEGYVEDITWRYTTIRQLPNDLVIVPNGQLASAVTVNFSLPDASQAVLVEVGVGYDSNLDDVERVTVEVAKEVLREVAGAAADFVPFIRFHTFGDSAIAFTVILRAQHYTDQYLLTHEFVKRLHRRYRFEGISIPYPQRTVHLQSAGSAA